MSEVKTVRGPVIENQGRVIYQVTLSSGMIVTSPEAFGPSSEPTVPPPVVTDDGRVLVPPSGKTEK